MTEHRRWLGREGEARAARFLETRGYRIVARNVRVDRVEIDLIARRGGMLVFVEVKSRRSGEVKSRRSGEMKSRSGIRDDVAPPSGHGPAAEAVDARKQRRLRRGAHAWLAENPEVARRTRGRRFDVVTCLFDGPLRSGNAEGGGPDETTAPGSARWSIEHWVSAF